jgi:hypothetical protein
VRKEIEAILSGVKDKKIEQVGPFWQIRVGARAGARENGISLARDLLREHREDVAPVPPQPLTAPLAAKPTPPQTDYDAIIAGLKAQLAEALAKAPEPVEIPEFLQDNPPAELADLFDPADTAPESNEKLLVRLREVLGLIGLAEDAGGRAAPELYRRKDRLESGIRGNRGRLAAVI